MSASPSTLIRGELIDIVEQELLGPRGGDQEEILGTPRAQYALGSLAPVTVDPERLPSSGSTTGDQAPTDAQGPGETGEAISDVDKQHLPQQGVPVETAEDAGSAEDDDDRDEGPKGALTHPSSMGLRFQVPRNCGTLTIVSSWGRYEGFRRENEEGRKVLYSQRTPYKKYSQIDVRGYNEHHILKPIELGDDVTLRVELFPLGDRTIVEVALSNDRVTGMDAPPKDWMFQTQLRVEGNSGEAVFLPTRDVLKDGYDEDDEERRRLDLQYRHRLEFSIGRTCSASWTADAGVRAAKSVETTWLPTADVAQTVPGGAPETVTLMKSLVELGPGDVAAAFGPLITGYSEWLAEQQAIGCQLPEHLQEIAEDAIREAEVAAERLREGVALLRSNPQALKAFQFMNRAMRDQRLRTQVAATRAGNESKRINDALSDLIERESEDPSVASWRPFQLAFVLLQLPSLTSPTHPYRSGEAANVELLFFPTGGGKTEAYLGLAAYTFAIRRLQGKIDTDEGVLDGGDGVAVLMRYTLRLLTSQQFQRAAALVCAAELIRQEDVRTWGEKPFSIGLWVGSTVSPKRYKDAEAQVMAVRADDSKRAHGLTVLQLQRCPWCGTKIDPKRDVEADPATERVRVYCGNRKHSCEFSIDGEAEGALPITTVDDEIYRNPPTFLLATVDKFARLAREGEAASLFGYVHEWCPRHGYRHPDSRSSCVKSRTHQAKGKHPSATMQEVDRLRPPDLIIQDELHLITGALGTAVGLFENAVDLLSSYSRDGQTTRPLIIASTATVANAENQVRSLYGRGVEIFPPQVLDVRDTYFSKEKAPSAADPGRKYLGICAHGIRLTLAEIRLSEVLLLAGQKLLDEHGEAADPYLTTVGYFSSTRELAGMRRYLDDDVTIRVAGKTEPFPKRTTDREGLSIGELTSRISAEQISQTLDKLSQPFSNRWSTKGRAAHYKAYIEAKEAGKPTSPWGDKPYDIVLATSMLQVGVDVPRLGLMLVVGQPKNTAEYIQASSRVGRDAKKPGLVVSLANWSRPRDMAHFEQFRHYHETFYAQVEALSVTPYSDTAMERGLMGVLVSVTRASHRALSSEGGAGGLPSQMTNVQELVERMVTRAQGAADAPESADRMRLKLLQRLDRWHDKAQDAKGELFYERVPRNRAGWPLLISPEANLPNQAERVFVVANSMREVQPEINLLVSPSADLLAFKEPHDAPHWEFPGEGAQ